MSTVENFCYFHYRDMAGLDSHRFARVRIYQIELTLTSSLQNKTVLHLDLSLIREMLSQIRDFVGRAVSSEP